MKLELHKQLVKKTFYSSTKNHDMPSYYKAYQMGSFASVNEELHPDTALSFEEFIIAFASIVKKNNLLSITFLSLDEGQRVALGVGFFWQRANLLEVAHCVWFPWVNGRQIYESFLNFFEGIRRTVCPEIDEFFKVIEFSRQEDEKFFDRFVQLGILEKVGKMQACHPNEEYTIIYATLRPKGEN